MDSRNGSQHMYRCERVNLVAGFSNMIQDKMTEGLVPHFINFMFRHLPGSRKVKMEIMKSEVERVHCILTTRIVRKPDKDNWRHLRPIFVGCPDLLVPKNEKDLVRNIIVNDGLHFNVIALVPPWSPLPPGMEQHLILPKQSRLKVSLKKHFEQQQRLYLNDRLDRIHVTPISYGTMSDYTLKAFINGRIIYDDILVLK